MFHLSGDLERFGIKWVYLVNWISDGNSAWRGVKLLFKKKRIVKGEKVNKSSRVISVKLWFNWGLDTARTINRLFQSISVFRSTSNAKQTSLYRNQNKANSKITKRKAKK